jgi:hypothetical protein
MKIKVFLTTLVVIISLLFNVGCEKNREYNEEEVLFYAEKLISDSVLLNEIYYGEGIPFNKDESLAEGYYYPASSEYLSGIGLRTVDDIKSKTRLCYSSSMADGIINTKLNSVMAEDGIVSYARYYQKYSALDGKEECIMVYKESPLYLIDKVEYDFDSLAVSEVKGEIIYVTLNAKVTKEEKGSQVRALRVALIEQTNGWRLDSPTYMRYVDEDLYNDLKK